MQTPEVATRGVLCKKVFLEISQNSQKTPVPGLRPLVAASGYCDVMCYKSPK